MSDGPPTRAEKLQAIRQNFIRELPQMMDRLSKDCSGLMEGPWQQSDLNRAYFQAHLLAGTAGTFGLTEVTREARKLEQVLALALESGGMTDTALEALKLAALQGTVEKVLFEGRV